MDRADYQRIRELYQRLADLPPEKQQTALLGESLSEEQRTELEALLDAVPSRPEFEEGRLGQVAARLVRSASPATGAVPRKTPGAPADEGRSIGGFRIVGQLGSGGMGFVYRARQDQPRREVALKVMHAFALDETARRRFEYEAEILARMDHPCVAKVFQAGIDATGPEPVPYIAMELVAGEDIVTHFEAGASPEEILRVFERVCSGVEHAHQRGVVHRDLKPANILVSPDDRPRILDFGIARPLQEAEHSTPGRTASGSILGSLAWMSPEQARGEVHDIDVRSDVYSLGLILFRLLTGEMPYDVSGLPPWKAAEVICDQPPKRLGRVRSELRGDPELIVNMALSKEIDRRYPSAGALAGDLRRFLANQPIEARPWSVAYQLRKFARRHRILMGAALLLASTVSLGFIVGITLWLRSERALATARREALTSERVVGFLVGMFTEEDPYQLPGGEVTVKQVLDRQAATIEEELAGEPLVRARLMLTMGQVYRALGRFGEATTLIEGARATRRAELGDHHLDSLQATHELGRLYLHLERFEEAEALFEMALEGRQQSLGKDHPDTITTLHELGNTLQRSGRSEQAEELLVDVVERRRATDGDDAHGTLSAVTNLANLYTSQGRFDEAERLYLESVEANRRVRGGDHPGTLASMNNLASLYGVQRRGEEAMALMVEVRKASDRVFGEDHPKTVAFTLTLAQAMWARGQHAEAEGVYLDLVERTEDEDRHGRARTAVLAGLAQVYRATGRSAKAEPLLVEGLACGRRVLGSDHPETLTLAYNLGAHYLRRGLLDQAQPLIEQAVIRGRTVMGAEHPNVKTFSRNLLILHETKVAQLRSNAGPEDPATLAAVRELADHLRSENRYQQADSLYFEALDGLLLVRESTDPQVLAAREGLARLFLADGRLEDAEAQAYELLDATSEDATEYQERSLLLDEILIRSEDP